ncbi:nickel transporter [Streptomyces yokosukanensis]|uniref:Nickel transporter n=1 Tax=Streptomyces yokosukanensis TaxID=67386 RepID=A0A124HEI9_9ACTN|nr:nickel transporter [Streptomyces yokosukanensis]KUN00879.1 nickel transporter [Streptomyces yokosukanensis]
MRLRLPSVLLATGALVLLAGGTAGAHPLGNFTVNRYDGLVAAPGRLRVDHVEDLAEIPATQAEPDLRRLGATRWARQRCARAAEGSRLTVDGRTTALTAVGGVARLRPGQAGLHTLRVECRLTAPLPRGATVTVGFRSAGAADGTGWREITARGDRMTLTATDVPKTSASDELTAYPKDLLTSPADTTAASVRLRPGGPALAEEPAARPGAAVLPRGADRWTRALEDLVARRDLTVGFAALALLVAVVLGALHALAPGHGKTLMAAAAAARGSRARPRDVLPLAASVTVTHTLGVVALGMLVTAGSAATPSVIAWLGIAGGALVLATGAGLVRKVWSARHHHLPHHVDHTHGGHTHGGHAHSHTHGGHTHTHPTAPTLRGTILLGFAGGLVPSPSAVVVLVGAAALGKAWFGLLLVVAYGAGLALTLTAAGFAVVRLGSGMTRVLERRPRWTAHPVATLLRRSVPLASALVVMALGAGLVLKGAASAWG